MICDIDPDLGMAQQLSGILKMIIDPDNMLTTPALNVCLKSNCSFFLNSPIFHIIYIENGEIGIFKLFLQTLYLLSDGTDFSCYSFISHIFIITTSNFDNKSTRSYIT